MSTGRLARVREVQRVNVLLALIEQDQVKGLGEKGTPAA